MSQSPSDTTAADETRGGPPAPPAGPTPGLDRLADHWGLVLGYGLLTTALGVALAVWPDESLEVLAILIAVQLLASGVVRMVGAIGATSLDGGVRALMAISGALALIVGLLCLRDPLQSILAIGILLGAWWLVSGVIDVVGAVVSPTPGRRGWDLASGSMSIVAGGFLLIYPDQSLGLFVLVSCLWLLSVGLAAVVGALALRSAGTRRQGSSPHADTPAPPAG